jgi:hypothetical protein
MPVTSGDVDRIHALMQPLVGQRAWGVRLGTGSFLTLEFGAQRVSGQGDRARVHGEWHLWVYCTAWRLDTNEEIYAASEDDRSVLEQRVPVLEGRPLTAYRVEAPALAATIDFSGLALRMFPVFSYGYEHWLLYLPDGQVLTAGPGATWSLEQAEQHTR